MTQLADRPARFGLAGMVAEREIRQRVRGRTFRIATLLLLLGVAAAVVIPALGSGGAHTERVGLVGRSSLALRQAVTTAARSTGTRVQVVFEPGAAAAERALRAGHVDVVVIDARQIVVDKASARSDPLPRALAALLGLAGAIQNAGLSPPQAAAIARAARCPWPVSNPPAGTTPDATPPPSARSSCSCCSPST